MNCKATIMKIKIFFIAIMSYVFLLCSCSKDANDGNSNCEAPLTITTSVFPLGTGVINYRDEAYCFGDSLLCTAVPNLNYEFFEWELGSKSPHSPPGNSAYFYIYDEESSHISAKFRAIDNSFISSSLNFPESFTCDTDRYPACEVRVERHYVSIGMTGVYATGPQVTVAVLGDGMHTGMTYELEDGLVSVSYDPDTSVNYDEYDDAWWASNVDLGSFTVNSISPETNTVEITFNNVYLENWDDEGEYLSGTISAQGLIPID